MAREPRLKRPAVRTVKADTFDIPVVVADMRQRVGSSQIDEFVLAHGASDVLRELVQNEFDANGCQIGLRFTHSALEITGTGRDIPPKGWGRLSVLIGTGEVLGDGSGEVITPKESSIGSKNLGMRSLFRFGDTIHVRSAGRMAILDLPTFTAGRQPDPARKGLKGILIQVPYRTAPLRRFVPFTPEREAADLDEIERVLFPTLVKLALPGRRRGVQVLTISSERQDRRLNWSQTAETGRSSIEGIGVVRRLGWMQARGPGSARSRQDHEELEFSRLIDIPAEHASLDFPDYYRSGHQLRVAVSIPLKAGKPVTDRLGHCYYPLQAAQARTGCAISVSAPFLLDAERTRLIGDNWNTWLNDEAANLVADLLGSDWFGRFGRAAYDLVVTQGQEERIFADLVTARLRERACWPNAEGQQCLAKDLVVPDHPALNGHVSASAYLHDDLSADADIAKLAIQCGAKRFTVNSLVRLRCGGEKDGGIATTLGTAEANYRYTRYPGLALNPEEQHRTASALTQFKRLSSENRRDLRETRTSLTATGALEAAANLVRVSPDMWEACPEPHENRLHPLLYDDLAVSRYCKPFDLSRWIEGAAERAAAGTITDTERVALYRHLLLPDTKLSSRLVGVIRKSPVIKDDQGDWARPDRLAILPARDAKILGRVVRAPAAQARQRAALLERLAIRRKVIGEDLTALADEVAAEPQLAEAFEELLRRHASLLTPKIVTALSEVRFLRTREGGLAAPLRAHIPTTINRTCLSADTLLVEDKPLYRRLSCPSRPGSAILIEVLQRAREASQPPPVPEQLYPALADALRADRRPPNSLADQPVLYVGCDYVTPNAMLVAFRPPRCLQESIPVLRSSGSSLADAYLALGASSSPKAHHWLAFFAWVDRRASASRGLVSVADRALIREAYRSLTIAGLPSDLAPTTLSLLSAQGTLHSLQELEAGRFLENDFPELAEKLIDAKAGIAFADADEMSRIIFRRLGIQPLSDQCGEGRIVIGALAGAPNWFREKTAAKAIEQLHRPELAQALTELAYAHQKQSRDFEPARTNLVRRRLSAIERIAFTNDLERTYQFGRRVSVPSDSAIEDGTLYLRPTQYKSEYDLVLALELARLVGATRLADIRTLASSLLPLLQLERPAEVLAYLRRLGIRPVAWDYVDEPGADEAEIAREQITLRLISSVRITPPSPVTPQPPILPLPAPTPPTPPVAAPPALPALADVHLAVTLPTGQAPPPSQTGISSGGWRSGTIFTPRTPLEMERDRAIGLQGEALVRRQEIARVRALGYDDAESRVVWVSQTNPGADHDILSIGPDGGPIWIEVKSTTGSDGRFDWSIAEFEKALREGPRYQLWRVYDVGGVSPTAKCFDNPAGLLLTPTIRLEISSLRVFVESR